MIGEDPYTLGLFDTAGTFPHTTDLDGLNLTPTVILCRSRGLRSSAPVIIPTDRCIPCLFQCNVTSVLRERQGEMVPRSTSSLSWCSLPYRRNTNRFEGRLASDRETGSAKAETGYE